MHFQNLLVLRPTKYIQQESNMADKKKPKLNIKKAIKRPGALRAKLGAKPGKPIPKAKLNKAAKAPGLLGQQARFAKTLSTFKKGKK